MPAIDRPKRFGILGSGPVGQTLARGLMAHGYEVRIGTRAPGKLGPFVKEPGTALAARAIEPLAVLWCIPGFLKNDWVHAFRLVRPAH